MPLDPLAKRLLTMMAAAGPQARSRPSVEARRQSLAKLMQFARAEAPDVATSDGTLTGHATELAYRLYTPASAEELAPGFVFFHGGGLVAGSIATHDRIAAALAHATGCRLVSVEYRLAPEHRFPAAVDDAIAATEWVAEADLSDYLPDDIDTADPRVSPLRATRLTGLPTAIIHTAEYDPMRDEGNAYARKLLAAGVAVEHVCHDGMVHNFHAMGAILPQAQLVLSQIGEQVRRAVKR